MGQSVFMAENAERRLLIAIRRAASSASVTQAISALLIQAP